jgi:hypothetical protein
MSADLRHGAVCAVETRSVTRGSGLPADAALGSDAADQLASLFPDRRRVFADLVAVHAQVDVHLVTSRFRVPARQGEPAPVEAQADHDRYDHRQRHE